MTLRLAASRLREIDRVLKDSAWGPSRTELYPTCDYRAVGTAEYANAK